MACLKDGFDRLISYLRISVTDRCNFRCVYCMPAAGINLLGHQDILTYEEIARVVRAAAELGVHKVRITGGEPLVRLGLADLVAMLAAIPGIDDLGLTTNGALLERYALPLKEAGLRRVNVSLDTLRRDRFAEIARVDLLPAVLAGIERAQAVGLVPVKLNTVIVRGLNDDEVVDMARSTLEKEWHLRFIELMPLCEAGSLAGGSYVSNTEVRAQIDAALGPLKAGRPGGQSGQADHDGPARYYRLPGARGTIGFISPVSERFCDGCNRLRLTAD
ncbi:MAG: GTP 3',8-cyclase MoaA, partial [Chloroflexi bacterium]|nr:GTP 3',8-cyclase MoaA [Chloroflexota bacterium]